MVKLTANFCFKERYLSICETENIINVPDVIIIRADTISEGEEESFKVDKFVHFSITHYGIEKTLKLRKKLPKFFAYPIGKDLKFYGQYDEVTSNYRLTVVYTPIVEINKTKLALSLIFMPRLVPIAKRTISIMTRADLFFPMIWQWHKEDRDRKRFLERAKQENININ